MNKKNTETQKIYRSMLGLLERSSISTLLKSHCRLVTNVRVSKWQMGNAVLYLLSFYSLVKSMYYYELMVTDVVQTLNAKYRNLVP